MGRLGSNQAANGTKVKNELDNYASMVRTTGNQDITGIKNHTSRIIVQNTNIDATTPGTSTKHGNVDYRFTDQNGVALAHFYIQQYNDGRISLYLVLRNTDGTSKYVNLGTSDVI